MILGFLLFVASIMNSRARENAWQRTVSGSDTTIHSRAFELRYVSSDPNANGETDFKGETEYFESDQRVEYLSKWAAYGRRFFNDQDMNTRIVSDNEIDSAVRNLKSQPLTQVRKTIPLEGWRYLGYRQGQREEEIRRLEQWRNSEGVRVEEEQLLLTNNAFTATFKKQSWRLALSWRARIPDTPQRATFHLSDNVRVGFREDGRFFYVVEGVEIPAGSYMPDEWYDFKLELDPEGGHPPNWGNTEFNRSDVEVSSEIRADPDDIRSSGHSYPASYATHGWNYWMAADPDFPQWIAFDLGEKRTLTKAKLAFRRDDGHTYDFRLEVSADKENWLPLIGIQSSSKEQWTRVEPEEFHEARYVRIYYTGASEPGYHAGLSMAEFYDKNGRIRLPLDEKTTGKYNFSVNGKKLADFVPLSQPSTDGFPVTVDSFRVEADGRLILDQIKGVGYDQVSGREVRSHPFLINTFMDENFRVRPDPDGFSKHDYDDSQWNVVPYRRYAHGGERRRNEALYLRKMVEVGDFERAVLNVETARPSADIYVNGKHVKQVGRHPERIDITDILEAGGKNLVAVRVKPYQVDDVRWHMSTDPWTGWFAGLMDIELTSRTYIRDVFAYATDIGDPAGLRLEATLDSEHGEAFHGQMVTRVYSWYPDASETAAGESSVPVQIEAGASTSLAEDIRIPDPALWTTHTPNLYKVHVILQDETGNPVDDFVLTTGLRTISQEGGTFRINGRPERLNGALLFGHHAPLERIAQWMFSPPKERWIHDILLTKRMNGNIIRMSVHDQRFSGINDRRLAQIGDQLGIMFMWQTPTWIRTGPTEGFDFEGLPGYMKQVRNHPAIVMWQVANHPDYTIDWFQKVHDTIADVDQTRLISPSADMGRMEGDFNKTIGEKRYPADDDHTYPSWTSPLIARGTMEQILGYGQDWASVRNFREQDDLRGIESEVRLSYLESETHAWFDFESEETTGQPNWNLTRGKPYHRMYSYEKNYDIGSIGRVLQFDEWQESQAWQALSAYETYRKKRWMGFDGMNWCPLRGGGNTATYMKPVVDYQNHAKLGYYALQMVFQPVLAGSKNVDMVYGPDDEIPLMIMNLGKSRTVDVTVLAKTMDDEIVDEIHYRSVLLPDGKGVVDLDPWEPDLKPEAYYAFEYIVKSVNEDCNNMRKKSR